MSANPDPRPATIDQVLAYWNRRPCNILHSPREVGSREYFDEVEARKYSVEPHIPGFAQFPRWRNRRVLEIGCGIGTDAVNFARHGAVYTGVDLSDVSIALARQRFAAFGLAGNLLVHNAEEPHHALPNASFDLVYSFGVIHHTPRPRAAIESARRLVSVDGELRIMLYARNSWKAMMIEEGLDQPEAQSGCPIALTYTADDVRELLAGLFDVVELRQSHVFPYIVEKYVRYEYELQPWFKAMPPELFSVLERYLGWHLLVVARPC
jgi:SAM-dependent methyltransferase